jgi:hypothetical protein
MTCVVLSGNMYNAVAPHPYVLIMEVVADVSDDFTYPYFVPFERSEGKRWIRVGPLLLWPKDDLEELSWSPLTSDEVASVHNALFRILSNN